MVKKLTLFFHKKLRERMESDDEFRNSPVPRAAMSFPVELMKFCLAPPLPHPSAYAMPDFCAFDLFTPAGRPDGMLLREKFEEASRIEIVLRPDLQSGISLSICFFRRGWNAPTVETHAVALADGRVFFGDDMPPE